MKDEFNGMRQTFPNIEVSVAISAALEIARARSEKIFVVGGVVRDFLAGRSVIDQDLDLVVEGGGVEFAHDLFHKIGGEVKVHPTFLTAKVRGPFFVERANKEATSLLTEIDIASTRRETYAKPGALPTVTKAPIEVDLHRRDFSINSMALELEEYQKCISENRGREEIRRLVLDPCGGVSDLDNRSIRVLHEKSFSDDPTRLFRAIRYGARLEFSLEQKTSELFIQALELGALNSLSLRRVWNEAIIATEESKAYRVIKAFSDRGLFHPHTVVCKNQLNFVCEALERLEGLRTTISFSAHKEAATLVLVTAMLRAGNEVSVQKTQVGKLISNKARRLIPGVSSSKIETSEVALLAAAFAVTGDARYSESISIGGGTPAV